MNQKSVVRSLAVNRAPVEIEGMRVQFDRRVSLFPVDLVPLRGRDKRQRGRRA